MLRGPRSEPISGLNSLSWTVLPHREVTVRNELAVAVCARISELFGEVDAYRWLAFTGG